jgi:simple sugar transport system permease protein
MKRGLLEVGRTLLLLVITFGIVAVIFGLAGFDVASVIDGVIRGAITSVGGLTATTRWAIPLVLLGLSVIISFRAGYFNIGAQGQFYVGAMAALTLALWLPDAPPILMIPATMVVGVIAGMFWSLFPGWLRVRYRTEEVLTTLMLNFIAVLLLLWLTGGPLQDSSGSGQVTASWPINLDYRIAGSSGVSATLLIITAAVVVASWLLINRTSFGLQSTLTGRNPLMARWQGVRVERTGLMAFGISGAIAGLAGSLELLGPQGRLVSGFSPDIGFTAVLVGLVGLLSVPGVVLAALFFGGLSAAVLFLPIVTPLPRSALDLLEGLIALLITARLYVPGFVLRWLDRRDAQRATAAPSTPSSSAEA